MAPAEKSYAQRVNAENSRKQELLEIAITRRFTQDELREFMQFGAHSIFTYMQVVSDHQAVGSMRRTDEDNMRFQHLLTAQLLFIVYSETKKGQELLSPDKSESAPALLLLTLG